MGANEDILYALSKDASSIEEFKRPMIKVTRLYARLYSSYRNFDKSPFRFWFAAQSTDKVNSETGPGTGRSKPPSHSVQNLGLDRTPITLNGILTKQVPKS